MVFISKYAESVGVLVVTIWTESLFALSKWFIVATGFYRKSVADILSLVMVFRREKEIDRM